MKYTACRIFYSTTVKSIPNYDELINEHNGVLPFEFLIVRNSNVIMSTIINRAYYLYTNEKMQFRAGRQKNNWGINTTWNLNDHFNIYNFDYEEREDAVRITYLPNYISSFDIASKFTDDWKTGVISALYKFNRLNYDFQFLMGKFYRKTSVCKDREGSIKNMVFKGKLIFFKPCDSNGSMNTSFSTSLDYSLKNRNYLTMNYLYNSSGSNKLSDTENSIFNSPNTEYPIPAKHTIMESASYMGSPIFSSSLINVYNFGIRCLTITPLATFSVMNNLDLDIIGQFFWQEFGTRSFQNIGNGICRRFKLSF
ncbi:hypothetical protein [Flavicella sp.]|uniref:hypothetical protein n=1 Tax=Flavicella sp. TaxID=2957742 RepID=UPI0030183F20